MLVGEKTKIGVIRLIIMPISFIRSRMWYQYYHCRLIIVLHIDQLTKVQSIIFDISKYRYERKCDKENAHSNISCIFNKFSLGLRITINISICVFIMKLFSFFSEDDMFAIILMVNNFTHFFLLDFFSVYKQVKFLVHFLHIMMLFKILKNIA